MTALLLEPEESPFPPGPHLLETAVPHSDLVNIGGIVEDEEGLRAVFSLEKCFLIGLMWAPATMSSAIMAALLGADAIPHDALLLKSEHRIVWETMREMADRGMPLTPILVESQIAARGERQRLKGFMLDAAAPTEHAPIPGGIELPYITAELVDGWYRRGHLVFVARMAHIIHTEPTAHLAGHWAALTVHQQNAERRWLAAQDALARLF